ncbi:MAG: hypothetical protein HYY68_00240 [Thaumarchaeota archaeon]|nr:hypothetical protein [Nitrososphaerota archaeon]MBI3022138.1 hypothetical protein [Nitrososphaerota archaeon]MBI3116574.1 hypothetical protein [Nitrososphaerota archaeon]
MSGPIRQAAWRLILPEIRKIVREEIADQLGSFRGEVQGEFKSVQGEFKAIQGEFKAVHSEIRRLDEKIESTDAKIDSVKDQLQEKIESVRTELGAKIDGLDKRMDLVQQVAVLQSKVSELEEKLQKSR